MTKAVLSQRELQYQSGAHRAAVDLYSKVLLVESHDHLVLREVPLGTHGTIAPPDDPEWPDLMAVPKWQRLSWQGTYLDPGYWRSKESWGERITETRRNPDSVAPDYMRFRRAGVGGPMFRRPDIAVWSHAALRNLDHATQRLRETTPSMPLSMLFAMDERQCLKDWREFVSLHETLIDQIGKVLRPLFVVEITQTSPVTESRAAWFSRYGIPVREVTTSEVFRMKFQEPEYE